MYPLVVGICIAVADARSQSTGYWISRSPLPTPRQEIPHAVLNGRIYIPGGLGSGGVGTSVVEVFDPMMNTWDTIAALPEALHHVGCVVANNRLYVLGGYTGSSFVPTDRVYEYMPDKNEWRLRAPMPAPRAAHVAVEFTGNIFVIGGVQTGVGATGRTDVFDPVANSWNTRMPMPTPREHLAGAAIDSLIYIVGGRVGASNMSVLEAYSPATGVWYARASMPTARGGLAAAALHGRLYVFGGEIPSVFHQNEEYDPTTNDWRTMAPMPTPRHGIGAATVGDSIFIIGGGPVAGYGVTDSNHAFVYPLPTNATFTEMLPYHASLLQNSPNPFNPRTNIAWHLSTTMGRNAQPGMADRRRVRLSVHDVLGREVATLVDDEQSPGSHTVVWDGTDQPSGVYFYRLSSGATSEVRRMLLLK